MHVLCSVKKYQFYIIRTYLHPEHLPMKTSCFTLLKTLIDGLRCRRAIVPNAAQLNIYKILNSHRILFCATDRQS